MARTKASVGAKVASGKSSKARCSVAPSTSAGPSGTSDKSSRSYSGGNPVCPRETPKWQKPITNFFITNKSDDDEAQASSSKQKTKKNIIYSDEESEEETPKNQEFDETIELQPLNGEECHKIEEYYDTKKKKNKGKGKKECQ